MGDNSNKTINENIKDIPIYVFDASSIYEAYINNHYEILYGNVTLSYAIYEIGNIIYKYTNLLKKYDKQKAIKNILDINNILKKMIKFTFKDEVDYIKIMKISLGFNSTFYDASYVYLANILDLPLITEDIKLREKVKDFIQTFSLKDISK